MWEIQNALELPPQQFHFQAIVLVMMMTSDVNWDDLGRTGTRNKCFLYSRSWGSGWYCGYRDFGFPARRSGEPGDKMPPEGQNTLYN